MEGDQFRGKQEEFKRQVQYARPRVTSSSQGILVLPEASPGVTFAPQTALVPLHFGIC